MHNAYVHGYGSAEGLRLQDQASTLAELLHADTAYPAGSRVLEAGCGVGAQTVTLARQSPEARITAIDISERSLCRARERVEAAGLTNVQFQQAGPRRRADRRRHVRCRHPRPGADGRGGRRLLLHLLQSHRYSRRLNAPWI